MNSAHFMHECDKCNKLHKNDFTNDYQIPFACVLCINKCSLIENHYGNLLKNGLYKFVSLALHECKLLRMNARMIYSARFKHKLNNLCKNCFLNNAHRNSSFS